MTTELKADQGQGFLGSLIAPFWPMAPGSWISLVLGLVSIIWAMAGGISKGQVSMTLLACLALLAVVVFWISLLNRWYRAGRTTFSLLMGIAFAVPAFVVVIIGAANSNFWPFK